MAKDVICKGTFDTDSNQSKKSVCNPFNFHLQSYCRRVVLAILKSRDFIKPPLLKMMMKKGGEFMSSPLCVSALCCLFKRSFVGLVEVSSVLDYIDSQINRVSERLFGSLVLAGYLVFSSAYRRSSDDRQVGSVVHSGVH